MGVSEDHLLNYRELSTLAEGGRDSGPSKPALYTLANGRERSDSTHLLPVSIDAIARVGNTNTGCPTPTAWPCVSRTMDVSAEAPLGIGNLRSPKSDKPLVAIGIEGSANKVRSPFKLFLRPRPQCRAGRPRAGAGDPMLRSRGSTDPAPRICFELGSSISRR